MRKALAKHVVNPRIELARHEITQRKYLPKITRRQAIPEKSANTMRTHTERGERKFRENKRELERVRVMWGEGESGG